MGTIISAAVIFAAVLWLSAGALKASSQGPGIAVILNGRFLDFKTPPVERYGYAFFPLEELLDGIGVSHSWDWDTYTVQGVLGGGGIEIPLLEPCYIVNGTPIDVPDYLLPFVENERTYVYLDFVVLAFNLEVAWDGAAKTITLIIPVETLELEVSGVTINKGETFTLTPIIYPANATDKRVLYTSSNTGVVTVSENGVVTAAGAGTADILCRSANGLTAVCTVTVTVPVEHVLISLTRNVYKIGETAPVTTLIYPEDATDKSVVVNVTGATVASDGNVYCAVGGVVTVVATAGNGVSDTKEITVVDLDAYRLEVVRLTNAERVKKGLQSLSIDVAVTAAAIVRTKELPLSTTHERPDGRRCFTALDEAGYNYRTAGENLAAGYKTPSEVVDGWMNSEGHRENILNDQFGHIGVGVEMDENGRLYWLQMFTD